MISSNTLCGRAVSRPVKITPVLLLRLDDPDAEAHNALSLATLTTMSASIPVAVDRG